MVTAIDIEPHCVAFINKTALSMECGKPGSCQEDVFQFLNIRSGSMTLVYADPPL